MQVVWGAGIRTLTGIATTQDQTLAFRTRAAFTARVECDRVNARAPCLPMRPLRVVFSAPVPAGRHRRSGSPTHSGDDYPRRCASQNADKPAAGIA